MPYLSKSSYMAGMECPRKLWLKTWDPKSASPPSGQSQLMMKMGIKFGELAHVLFPGATLIDIDIFDLNRAVEDTRNAIDSGAHVILEAAFAHEQCRILADVVKRQEDGSWHLIEVKSSSEVKDEHITDLAYQKWVIEKAGYRVSKTSVIHANKEGIWPDVEGIFAQVEVTDKVDAEFQSVEANLADLLPLIQEGAKAPELEPHLSRRCHDCDFKKNVCWANINRPTIYDVVDWRKIPPLEQEGILYVEDIPNDFPLNAKDQATVRRIVNQEIDIDRDAIQATLATLEYPIYFLDFEFVRPPIPLFDGYHPGERVSFQYSLHRLNRDGTLNHFEYLHFENSDPSRALAKDLVHKIGTSGSVVVYSESVERGVIRELARKCPEFASALLQIEERLWDLMPVFKNHLRDWKFMSKWGLKIVTENLIPEFAYQNLEVSDGGTASFMWVNALEEENKNTQRKINEQLKAYCERDTRVMVELLKYLQLRLV